MRISDWSSDVCSSDLKHGHLGGAGVRCAVVRYEAITEESGMDDPDRGDTRCAMKPLAAPVLIARCRCLHLRREADTAVQSTASLDPIGAELARRLPHRRAHPGSFPPIGAVRRVALGNSLSVSVDIV